MNITLDMNCLIDLELNKGSVNELKRIVAFHDSFQIALRVPAIGASERMKSGDYASDFSVFQERVHKLSQREIDILRPILYLGIGYLGWSLWASQEMVELEQKIHEIMFPGIAFGWIDYAQTRRIDPQKGINEETKEWRTWRNRKCDTLAMWCHIYYEGDIFVTRDSDFHKPTKKPALIKLGAKSILDPRGTLDLIGHGP